MIKKNYSKDIKNFERNGWVHLKKVFNKYEIKNVENLIINFLTKQIYKKNKNKRAINFISNKTNNINEINSFHELSNCKKIRKLANSKKIKLIAKSFLKSKPEFRCCELFAKPAKKGLPAPIHQDNFYWGVKGSNALTIWVALEKSNKKNGSVFYFNGSHKFGVLDHKPSYAKGSSQKISNTKFLKKFKISQPNLDPGDILIHHSLVVHGSSKNNSNYNRKGWTIQFKDKHADYDFNQIKKYEKSLNNQIETRS